MLADQPVMPVVITSDISKARPFYENTLGLTVQDADEYGVSFCTRGSFVRLSILAGFEAAPYAILSWVVKDIVKTAVDLKSKGVVFQLYEGMSQDELGIWTTPGGAKVAWFQDPDGNVLSLTQF
jgi:catechol 2,3-dioxygenase-like lactoylglutathione lyase family enzyme